MAPARAALGETCASEAWLCGNRLDFDAAVAYAFTKGDHLPPGDQPAKSEPLLSGRELEVMRLMTAGLTAREIANQLVLSPRTVERHVDNIYTKTGAHGRVAAAYALRNGLVNATE